MHQHKITINNNSSCFRKNNSTDYGHDSIGLALPTQVTSLSPTMISCRIVFFRSREWPSDEQPVTDDNTVLMNFQMARG